jgi:type IVB pilus formation R64 PilN family outer membrane protein
MCKWKCAKYLSLACTSFSLLTLYGCANESAIKTSVTQQANQYSHKINQAYQSIDPAHQNKAQQNQVKTLDKYYFTTVKRQPLWLQSNVVVNGTFDLRSLMKQLLQNADTTVEFRGGADANQPVTLHFNGPISGALKQVAQLTGYYIDTNSGHVVVSDMTTRTFQINAIPGKADYDIGKTQSQYPIGNLGEGSSGSSGSGSSNQFSKESASVDAWKDVNSAIKSILSKSGKFEVSQSSSTITITDHAQNIKRAAKWIKKYNSYLGRQVSFKIQLISVELNDNYNRGINWSAIFRGISLTQPDLLGTILQTSSNNVTQGISTTAFTLNKGHTSVALSLLAKQGKIADQYEPILTTLNNRMAQLREVHNISYLEQISSSTVPLGTSASQQNTLTPGTITTGLEVFIIPHITKNKVYMKISIAIANLDAMNSIGQLDGKDGVKGIQLPVVSVKRFNQDASLSDGQTLVIGGFKYNQSGFNNAKNFGLSALGAFSSAHSHTELVLMITPYLSTHTSS